MTDICQAPTDVKEVGHEKGHLFPVNYSPDEELFMERMRDMALQTALPSLFGALVAIFIPHIGQVIYTVADL